MDTVSVPLVDRHNAVIANAIIDAGAADSVLSHKWLCRRSNGKPTYAYRYIRVNGKQVHLSLHEVIAGAKFVDHVNRNGLDNRLSNLRLVTHAQNMQNRGKHKNGTTSPERGVSWCNAKRRWRAEVKVGGKHVFSKYTPDHEMAVAVVREARQRLFTHATN